MKVLLALLAASLALGCAERQITMIEVKSVPKSAKKVSKSKPVAIVNANGKRTEAHYIVYEVGTTVNEAGDLVGPRKVYRLVETSVWSPGGKPKLLSPKTFVQKDSPKDELSKAVAKAEAAAERAEAANNASQTRVANQTQSDPTPTDSIREQFQGFGELPSPTPDPDQEAAKKFTKATGGDPADPKNP